ncbi:hypothetical protein HDG34_003310 [Paraburkholderia sp. HC6.4b]|uniref:hypothetical protein n=1 Tax=unclassified Paraburkholderia TaxID=2615204 RepID=UPI0016195168|nr:MULTISPECIES: hypothetical protein [unclassified Paraburkholderia]MBB5409369.1 hypothetical protein [Paraburkholderia sp. HC6.4b]MBB5451098.1 hypothetical protein [Paraburkholderia sp. Kb1A]
MDLDDALSAVEHLAARHRLLVGRGCQPAEGEPPDIDWGAGDIRDVRKLRGLEFVSEIGPQLVEIYENYVAGRPHAVTSITWSKGTLTVIVLGAESPEQVAEALRSGADELVSLTVKGYLSDRFSDWKQPLAQVLRFPGRRKS